MNLSNQVLSIIDDPYFSMFSLLVFERLTVEDIPDIPFAPEADSHYVVALNKSYNYHKQRKGE